MRVISGLYGLKSGILAGISGFIIMELIMSIVTLLLQLTQSLQFQLKIQLDSANDSISKELRRIQKEVYIQNSLFYCGYNHIPGYSIHQEEHTDHGVECDSCKLLIIVAYFLAVSGFLMLYVYSVRFHSKKHCTYLPKENITS